MSGWILLSEQAPPIGVAVLIGNFGDSYSRLAWRRDPAKYGPRAAAFENSMGVEGRFPDVWMPRPVPPASAAEVQS